MKHRSLLLSTVVVTAICVSCLAASAQDKQNYKFDEYGLLSEFNLIMPDSTVIQYKHKFDRNKERTGKIDLGEGEYARVVYPNGTIVDYSASLVNTEYYYDDGFEALHPAVTTYEPNPVTSYNYYKINDWYKRLRELDGAPIGPNVLLDYLNLKNYTILFPDNAQLTIGPSTIDNDGTRTIETYVDVDKNGDYISASNWTLNGLHLDRNDCIIAGKENEELAANGCIVSGVRKDGQEYVAKTNFLFSPLTGSIVFRDGSKFSGTFYVAFNKTMERREIPVRSPYIKQVSEKMGNKGCILGFDNFAAILFNDGNLVNKENKLVAMYRNTKRLDEFDMASEIAAEQGRIDQAAAAAKKAIIEKNAIIAKYGKKNADAFFAGKVIVGMPLEMVELGLKAESFKDFSFAMLSIDRSSAYGHSQCLSLYDDHTRYVGFIWVIDDKVSSVTFY